MSSYEYGRIKVLAANLAAAGVAADITEQILEGGEAVRKTATAEAKAAWMPCTFSFRVRE